MKILKIKLPKGYMNTGITIDGYFIADTNNSANMDVMKIQLPKGKWSIKSIKGKDVILQRNTFISQVRMFIKFRLSEI